MSELRLYHRLAERPIHLTRVYARPNAIVLCGLQLSDANPAKSIQLCGSLLGIFVASCSIALIGWSWGAARKFFPLHICFFAPLWVFERSLSTYWAVYWFLRRGGYPFGDELLSKGIGRDWVEGGKIAARQ